MTTRTLATLFLVAIFALLAGAQAPVAQEGAPAHEKIATRFVAVDVYIDAGAAPLAAYQFELRAPGGVTIVGLEGGAHAAFAAAPYYDARALAGRRVVVGAFSLSGDLPTGRTRVARVHVEAPASGSVDFQATLIATADAAGQRIDGSITAETGGGS